MTFSSRVVVKTPDAYTVPLISMNQCATSYARYISGSGSSSLIFYFQFDRCNQAGYITWYSAGMTLPSGTSIVDDRGVSPDFTFPTLLSAVKHYTSTAATSVANSFQYPTYNKLTGPLFISKYIKGRNFRTAIELFNPNCYSVNLAEFVLAIAPKGMHIVAFQSTPIPPQFNSFQIQIQCNSMQQEGHLICAVRGLWVEH